MNLRFPRYDYFLIWGHGLPFRDRILSMIRNHAALKIVKILHHIPETIDRLVEAIYSYDYAPIAHLRGKTRYLKGTPGEVYFVFVENHDPDEDYFGEGAYRHIESRTIKALKEEIRNLFNPRMDGKRTEDHVVHASDNQLQTDYILKYLAYDGVDLFAERHLALEAPYHLSPITDYAIRNVPVSTLVCRVVAGSRTDFVPHDTAVEETPHFKALCGDCEPYERYVDTFLGGALTDDHSLESFLRLKEGFRYLCPPHDGAYIIVKGAGDDRYVVVDGVHRAALLRYHGVSHAHVAVI